MKTQFPRNQMMLSLAMALASGGVQAQSADQTLPSPSQPTAFTMSSGTERTQEQLAVIFEHADLSLKIDPATRSITGKAILKFKAKSNLTRLVVELDKNLPIDAVRVNAVDIPMSAVSNPEGRLSVQLPQTLKTGEVADLEIRYHGVPRIAQRAPWDGGFVWTKTPTGEPWIASAVQGEGCDLFWPCIDHPMGKPNAMSLHFSVPAPLVVAANGISKGMEEKDGWRTYHWLARMPSTYGISINVGPYSLMEGQYKSRFGNTIPLKMWYLPANKAKAEGLFAEFAPMLDFFESRIGPYPFGDEKMGVVETPHLGMEHQTVNAYGNEFIKSPHGYDWLLHHEFSHEWFGNQLTNENWDDFWLHEGFGSYMQPLYLQYLRGERDYQVGLFEQRNRIVNKFPVVTGHSMSEHEVSNGPGNDVYFKGSLMLHTLRSQIGDELFFKSIRQLVYGRDDPKPGNFQPRYSTTKEYISIVNKLTGKDWSWFFKSYLMNPSLPKLVSTREAHRLLLQWQVADGTEFPLPVEVSVNGKVHRVAMKQGKGELSLPVNVVYTIDPGSKILRDEARIEEWRSDVIARRKSSK
ncbi:M1 family metallopeptidase [Undibacterium cyanobacteriorum]|uniref:Aminopeptidase N n=1 Tax=Undibacterium cyanobacteriorum TaxID=3073561 RepID=A0ABY9RM15_9BURK|nr:M1 family metallopeptidase [Undibacterium sp. 20NA77.5]WMW81913.1 M1 family metallopeptidase [Undibacterium sp. 20NA77.5]